MTLRYVVFETPHACVSAVPCVRAYLVNWGNYTKRESSRDVLGRQAVLWAVCLQCRVRRATLVI